MFYDIVILELDAKKSLKILFNSTCYLLLNRGIEDMNPKMLLLLMLIAASIFPSVITASTAQEEDKQPQQQQQQQQGSGSGNNDQTAGGGSPTPIVNVNIEGTERDDKIKGGD